MEHGLPSICRLQHYGYFNTMTMEVNENTSLGVSDYDAASATMKEAAVKVETVRQQFLQPKSARKVVVIAKACPV